MQLVATIPVGNALGECVLWDDRTQSVWWTDIEGLTLHRLDWPSRTQQSFATPERLASFGLVEGRRDFIAAFACGLALFDPVAAKMGTCLEPEGLLPGMRMNDGRVDRQGRFWAGSMVEDSAMPSEARLYCLNGGRIETHLQRIGIANGLCWSPDGTTCYFADSRAKIIWRFAFDTESRVLSGCREFARSSGSAAPDGAAVDAEGYVWSAQWGGGCVTRYDPDGRIDRVMEVPVSQPTCVTFGGADLDLLFVTSAHTGPNPPQTGAGDLFVYSVGVRGLPEARFKLIGWPEGL